jgi:hypothetical protein
MKRVKEIKLQAIVAIVLPKLNASSIGCFEIKDFVTRKIVNMQAYR